VGKVTAWLRLTRLVNLPSVWSNVLHGLGVGLLVGLLLPVEQAFGERPAVTWGVVGRLLDQTFVLLVAVSLLYAGGMVLNDVADVAEDSRLRPGRPIPAGLVGRRTAMLVGLLLLLGGWLCLLVYRPTVVALGSGLVAAIVAYNLLHRVRVLGIVLMAVCRGLVVLIAAWTIGYGGWSDAEAWRVWCSVTGIACYTGVVTLLAWREALPSFPRLAGWIGTLIALMPLVDAGFLALHGLPTLAGCCVGCAVLCLGAQRFSPGS
jgi:4-hydroxybenzoate polyprenyltransferase